jgi:uncharacterized membrane protein YhaH (DUF805 family)
MTAHGHEERDMNQHTAGDPGAGQGPTSSQLLDAILLPDLEPDATRKPTFLGATYRDFLRPFSFGGIEPRREFWTFALVGVPLAGAVIAALALFAAVLSLARILPEAPANAGSPSDLDALVREATATLHGLAAPFAAVPGFVITAIVFTAALLQAWLLLSLVAATRRRLADAGADRSLALVWPLLPAAALLNVPGGMTIGIGLIAAVMLLAGPGGRPAAEAMYLLAVTPVGLPVLACAVLILVLCLRASRDTAYARRPKLGWVLLCFFAPALVWVLISLPVWGSLGAWLEAAGAEAQAISGQIILWIGTWVVLPILAFFGIVIGMLSGGVVGPKTHKVGMYRRLTKKGYVNVKAHIRKS